MKNKICIIVIILFIIFSYSHSNAQSTIDYLNQKSPTQIPEVFAKGSISSSNQEHSLLCISHDGSEMWWSLWELPYSTNGVQKIYHTKKINESWEEPKLASFSGKYKDGGPFLTYDGNRLFFYSRRPIAPDTLINDNDIWYVERIEKDWGEPINMGSVINTEFVEANPVLVKNNNLYFTSNRENKNPDIYLSQYINGNYTKPVKLGSVINTEAREMFFTVSPNESFIIFTRDGRRFSESGELIDGDRNLMISFKNKDGEWVNAKNMGPIFNEKKARFPSLSPDGKYLYFTRYTEGNDEDFYWVDASIINELR